MALGRILLLYDGSEEAAAALRLACQLVDRQGCVIALCVLCIPLSLPLDPLPSWIDQDGHAVLDQAESVAAAEGIGITTILTRGRRAADEIVEEAVLLGVDAIFLPLPAPRRPWKRLRAVLTARAVLRRTRCPVLLGSWLAAARPADRRDMQEEVCRPSVGYSSARG